MGGFNNHDNSNNHLYGFGCSHVHIRRDCDHYRLKAVKEQPQRYRRHIAAGANIGRTRSRNGRGFGCFQEKNAYPFGKIRRFG